MAGGGARGGKGRPGPKNATSYVVSPWPLWDGPKRSGRRSSTVPCDRGSDKDPYATPIEPAKALWPAPLRRADGRPGGGGAPGRRPRPRGPAPPRRGGGGPPPPPPPRPAPPP